jgi:hypothetical protein
MNTERNELLDISSLLDLATNFFEHAQYVVKGDPYLALRESAVKLGQEVLRAHDELKRRAFT